MGLTVRSSSILGIARGLAITKVCKATRMLRPLKFSPKTIFRETRKGWVPRTFKQFRNKMHDGASQYGFPKMKVVADKKGGGEFRRKARSIGKMEGISSKAISNIGVG